jgi:molybdate transport system ATP-binding protein
MGFDIDVTRRLGGRAIGACFASDARLVALFGPSGAGKTSVLNMVAGLLRPDHGHVRVAGRTLFDAAAGIDIPARARRVGYVFQDRRLFPHRSVGANLRYGWRIAAAADRWLAFDDAVALLDLAPLLDRRPATLSGGEAQRVAIGRALLAGASVLLLDEPLAALDRARREEILGVIERVRDALALPILYVSHDRAEVDRLTRHVVEV